MKKYDFTVVGTAATVSILHVEQMSEMGKSTPVYGNGFLDFSHGGMGLNICAGLANLGLSVYPVLTYADDRQRTFLHQFVQKYKMPEDGIWDPPVGAAGTTLIIQDVHKNHMTLITGYENRLVDSSYYGHQIMEPHFFCDSKMIVLTAPMAMNTEAAINAIQKSGTELVFSIRKDLNALPHDFMWQTLQLTSILFANETEIDYLKEEFQLKDICDLFQNGKMKHIVETLGANGSRVYSMGDKGIQVTQVDTVPSHTDEIETVGAGDGYVSGFLYGYIQGKSISECAQLGGTVSSFALEKEGSITNLPSKEELLARYEENNSNRSEK